METIENRYSFLKNEKYYVPFEIIMMPNKPNKLMRQKELDISSIKVNIT